ncbi:MAG: hypothetical protein Sapg2KO_30440 [Saprospiraceae bacterium]
MTLLFNFVGPEIFVIVFALLLLVPWIWAIVDIVKSQFKTKQDKALYLVLALAFPLVGTCIYYFYGQKQKLALIETSEFVDSPKL